MRSPAMWCTLDANSCGVEAGGTSHVCAWHSVWSCPWQGGLRKRGECAAGKGPHACAQHLEALRRVVGDLGRDLLLAAREEGHVVPLLHQLPRQVQANEAGATWLWGACVHVCLQDCACMGACERGWTNACHESSVHAWEWMHVCGRALAHGSKGHHRCAMHARRPTDASTASANASKPTPTHPHKPQHSPMSRTFFDSAAAQATAGRRDTCGTARWAQINLCSACTLGALPCSSGAWPSRASGLRLARTSQLCWQRSTHLGRPHAGCSGRFGLLRHLLLGAHDLHGCAGGAAGEILRIKVSVDCWSSLILAAHGVVELCACTFSASSKLMPAVLPETMEVSASVVFSLPFFCSLLAGREGAAGSSSLRAAHCGRPRLHWALWRSAAPTPFKPTSFLQKKGDYGFKSTPARPTYTIACKCFKLRVRRNSKAQLGTAQVLPTWHTAHALAESIAVAAFALAAASHAHTRMQHVIRTHILPPTHPHTRTHKPTHTHLTHLIASTILRFQFITLYSHPHLHKCRALPRCSMI